MHNSEDGFGGFTMCKEETCLLDKNMVFRGVQSLNKG